MTNFFEEQRSRWNGNYKIVSEVLDDVALARFQKFRPPIFNGKSEDEAAEKWIEGMEKIFKALKYPEERKVSFGEFQLEGLAKEWCRVLEEKWELERKPRVWNAFLDEFWKRFIPKVVRERKKRRVHKVKTKDLNCDTVRSPIY